MKPKLRSVSLVAVPCQPWLVYSPDFAEKKKHIQQLEINYQA